MYNLLPQGHDNIIGLHIQAQLNHQDTKTLFPFLKSKISKHGTIRILFALENFKGFKAWTLLSVAVFIIRYRLQLSKLVIITDQAWVEGWVSFLSPVLPAQISCFPKADLDGAWEWIKR